MAAASSPAPTARRIGVFNSERTGGALVISPARMTDIPPRMATSLLSNNVLLFPHHIPVRQHPTFRSDQEAIAGRVCAAFTIHCLTPRSLPDTAVIVLASLLSSQELQSTFRVDAPLDPAACRRPGR